MKKHELVEAVANRCGEKKSVVNSVIEELANVIVEECVTNGGEISIPNLGRFRQKNTPARQGFNPLTKEKIMTKASRTLRFNPVPSIKVVEE